MLYVATGRNTAYAEGEEADDEPARAAGGHVEHGDEHREEHERSAQIVLQNEHAHRGDPHDHNRSKIAQARQLQA